MNKDNHEHIQELINDPERTERATHLLSMLKCVTENYRDIFLVSRAAKIFHDGLLNIASSEHYMTPKDRLVVQEMVVKLMYGAFIKRSPNKKGDGKDEESNTLYNAARAIQEVALLAERYGFFTDPYEEASKTGEYAENWETNVNAAIATMKGLRTYCNDILFENLGIIGFENALKRVKMNKGEITIHDVKGLELAIGELTSYNHAFVKENWPNKDDKKIAEEKKKLGTRAELKKSTKQKIEGSEDIDPLKLHEPQEVAYSLLETVLKDFCLKANLFPEIWLLDQNKSVGI